MRRLASMAVLRYLAQNLAQQYPTLADALPIIALPAKLLAIKHVIHRERFLKSFMLDQKLFDIPLDVWDAFPSTHIPRQDVRIED